MENLISVGIISFIVGVGIGAILMAAINSDKKDRNNCKCNKN